MDGARRRVLENPFYVLGLAPDAGRAAVEIEGQKLLAMIEVGFPGVERYATPVGPGRRSADDVRRALAELRDPARRLVHELWACLTPAEAAPAAAAAEPDGPEAWPEALAALGWTR